MPVSPRGTTQSDPNTHLRPYTFHGVHLSVRGSHAVGDCPFCGREGKFSIDTASGLWRCFVCGAGTEAGGGNGLVFTRLAYEIAATALLRNPGAFHAGIAADRRLLSPATAAAWGVVPALDGVTWLVPGYGTDGKLDQVYRRVWDQTAHGGTGAWQLRPTPGIWPDGKVHALHMPIHDFDPARPNVVVCEGPWDGMALWELWGDRDTNIVAVPGCGSWRSEWSEMCRGKVVTLMYDSDHPREHIKGRVSRAGYDAMVRVAKRLSGIAASVRWLKWGPDGYDPTLPSGFDVRDMLTQGDGSVESRKFFLAELMLKVEDAPSEWFNPTVPMVINGHRVGTEVMPCSTWADCEGAWKDAMYWRADIADALAALLAVCASTKQSGNQLFLDLIGSPGSAKTTLCRGLLVSGHCIHLENVTKLISGFKKPGDGDKDCSFLARANNKTWVTCEFDTLSSSPQYHDLMGKVRRIFDGETSATYGNSDEDRIYTAMRTPWIRAGTPKMMDHDQSQLGDRFIRYILTDPDESEKRKIAKRALQLERSAIMETANCTAGSITDPKTRRAQSLTGGYVDWLRANIEEQLGLVDVSDSVEDYCIDLAELSADLRARPQHNSRNKMEDIEAHDYKELPTRLSRQNIRMASCLAVVLNKRSIDADVLRITRKIALDTAAGHSLNMVQWLCSPNPRADCQPYQECGGLMTRTLEMWTGMSPERMAKYLGFLRKIGVLEWREIRQSFGAWFLTDRVYNLYLRVMQC